MTVRNLFWQGWVGCTLASVAVFVPALPTIAQGAARLDSAAAPIRPVSTLLDGPISRTAYRLGAGDLLDVSILGTGLGDLNRVITVSVSPEGNVLLPAMGPVRVLGLSLDVAEQQVRAQVLKFYRNIDVSVSLAAIRSFKVYVVGNIASAGVRGANAATRVSELIPDVTSGAHRRNVNLRRANGDTISVDLVRFLQTGDLSANPTLREGDVLTVPIVDRSVTVFGRVFFPGAYEYRADETLAELLSIANGAGDFPSNVADTIRIARFVGQDRREFQVMTRADAVGAVGRAFKLQPSDAIFVSEFANYRVQKTATVIGQVKRPGPFPIRPETTTVRELIAMAGGFTPDASLVLATLHRQLRAPTGEEAQRLQRLPGELLNDEERRILYTRNLSDPTSVVIDFTKLYGEGGAALDQTLEADDVIDIPPRRSGVTVLGAVSNPGIIRHAPGRGIDYYVALAGGYGRQADFENRAILRARLGNRVDARDVPSVEEGDQIIVPFREPTRYLQRLQTIVAVTTGILISILTLKNLLSTN